MHFEDFLKTEAKRVEKSLDKLLFDWLKEVGSETPELKRLAKALIDSCKGGKRIRGVLVSLGYQMGGGKLNEDIHKIAAALEIFHVSFMVHDDIIDKSLLRRGVASLYQSLGGNHYAISQAICLADLGFSLSFGLISKANFPDRSKNIALTLLSNLMTQTAKGEMLDIEMPHKKTFEKETTFKIALLKTAVYSTSGPLMLGAILAGANQDLVKELKEIGDNLGIAYQIQDDILGVFGSEDQMGKSQTTDIKDGKATLLIAHALEKANSSQKKILNDLYGNPNISETEMEQIKKIFLETGALDFAKSRQVEYTSLAENLIDKLNLSDKDKLKGLARYLVNRSK